MKKANDNGTATRMDKANSLIFPISRYCQYEKKILSMDMSGSAIINPARTGFLPASHDAKAMTTPEKTILIKNHMVIPFC